VSDGPRGGLGAQVKVANTMARPVADAPGSITGDSRVNAVYQIQRARPTSGTGTPNTRLGAGK